MFNWILLVLTSIFLVACHYDRKDTKKGAADSELPDITHLYSTPSSKMVYSKSVSDSFKIFISLPELYGQDPTKKYPLILMLDANAYFEPVLSELKLGTLTQGYPKSIVIGIGYKNFGSMDSLRDRDYTYPAALAADSFNVSGGGQKFKRFIDQELLPYILADYKVDHSKIVLMGHSLGGYFSLYYLLDSIEKGESKITNFIAASPSLYYYNKYLLSLERKSTQKKSFTFQVYVSSGSLERDSTQRENLFLEFTDQLKALRANDDHIKYDEYSHFNHMDAAMPGFMKGLIFVFEI
jgi:predicted alpha/beta superfamily hydrolase